MLRIIASRLMPVVALALVPVYAQAPTGTILGTVTDASGAVIPGAIVTVTNRATNVARALTANAQGLYSAPALPPGDYEVRSEMQGFRTLVRDAQVATGSNTTVDLAMQLGETREVVTVEAATAQINYENQAVAGVIGRSAIQDLPLNGRSSLQLAVLEPGVVVNPGSQAQFNALFNVQILGGVGGVGSIVSLDGGTINDEMEGGTSMNFSQDIVQEFQLAALNYDVSTGISTNGGVNIVTRSGSNDFHGSAYFFFRDHNMAAYPGLQRNALNPNPFFVRRNPGAELGGPILKDKLFFFFNYEYMNQTTVYTEQQDLASLQPLNAIYPSPYRYHWVNARFDYRISAKHVLFVRYTHDGNHDFGPYFGAPEPSQWNFNDNWSDQSIMGLTSTLTPNLVSDFRFQFHYWQNNVTDSTAAQCQPPCVGFGQPSIVALIGSGTFGSGVSINSPQLRQARSFEPHEDVSWQKGAHRIRFGIDYEHMWTKTVPWDFCDPGCEYAVAPETILPLEKFFPAGAFASLPTKVRSDADLLNLPLFSLTSSIYSGIGVGNGTFPGHYEHGQGAINQRVHPYIADTWKVRPNLTVNAALGYDYESGLFYSNLNLPQYVAPILEGQTGGAPYGLGATQPNSIDIAPQVGFAWALGKDKKTVIRGGAGMYWDTQPIWEHFREGAAIGPLGDGRTTLANSVFNNIFPNLYSIGGAPLPIGAPLPLNTFTNMTFGQFTQIYQQQFPALLQRFSPTPPASGPYSVSGIDVAKQGIEIYPSQFPLLRSYQTSIGVQRDLGHDMVLTVDWARRQGENNNLGELDLNRFARYINGVQTPVIPKCAPNQVFVPGQECSTGSITMWTPEGRSVYDGLLVNLQKRLSHRVQFNLAYAYQKLMNLAGGVDLSNFANGWGPATIPQHNLNLSGTGNLPWGITLSVINTIQSRLPVEPVIPGTDINGAGNATFPLTEAIPAGAVPGLGYNCFNFGCGKSQLTGAVNYFNANIAGTKTAAGATIPKLILPSDYQFGDPLYDQDVRLTKAFTFKERYTLNVFGEFFNLLNIANLSGYGYNLDKAAASGPQTFAFGQPTARVQQVFGSGGPRAIQIGARFTF